MLALVLALMAFLSGSVNMSTATAIAGVVRDSRPLYDGPEDEAKWKTAAALVVWTYHESHWQNGTKRGDQGRSVCLGQVMVSRKPTAEWSQGDKERAASLEASPRYCLQNVLYVMRESIRLCGHLGAYASGSCNDVGRAIALRRELDQTRILSAALAE